LILANSTVVIFDCDDTILATASSRWQVLINTASKFGAVLSERTIRQFWGLPFDELIQSIVPTLDPTEFIAAYRLAMQETQPSPTTGAVELLEKLAHKGTVMEVVTSSSRDIIIQDLDQLDLTKYFANIYGQEQTRFHKPDPRVLHVVVNGLMERGFDILRTVFIGDSVRDYKVAYGNDIEFIAVLSGLEGRSDFVRMGVAPSRIVDSLGVLAS
jgi:phosphoglycolate phosphatase-like HAD superfamily hydrolase